MNDGQTYKVIRTSRNISQKDISQDRLSRTTISKFENNRILLSINNFNYLLAAIDVSVEEFNYIKNNYSYMGKEKIIFMFNQLFSNSNEVSIKKLIELCEEYLKNNYSKSIRCIYLALNVLKYMHESPNNKMNCYTKIYAADIWNELSNVDTWTILDIKIINCCLHFFEPSTYLTISKQLTKSLDKYKNFSNIVLLEAAIYLNLSLLFLLNNEISTSKKYIKMSLEKSYESKRIDYIAMSLVRKGVIFNEKDSIDNGLSLLNILGEKQLTEAILIEINDLQIRLK